MNPFLRYLADKNSAHRQTHRHTPMTTRPCGLRRAGNDRIRYFVHLHKIQFRKQLLQSSYSSKTVQPKLENSSGDNFGEEGAQMRLPSHLNTSLKTRSIAGSIFEHGYLLLHCALASCGAVYCNWFCLWVCLWLCLWVCYHDNSKLRASISPNWVCR